MDGKHLLDASLGDMMINFESSPLACPPTHPPSRCQPLLPTPRLIPIPASTWPPPSFVEDNNPFDLLSHRSELNRDAGGDPFEMVFCSAATFNLDLASSRSPVQNDPAVAEVNDDVSSASDVVEVPKSSVPDMSSSLLNFSTMNDDSLLDAANPCRASESATIVEGRDPIAVDRVSMIGDSAREVPAVVSVGSDVDASAWSSRLDSLSREEISTAEEAAKRRSMSCTATCGDTSISLNTAFRSQLQSGSDSAEACCSKPRSASCSVATPDTVARLQARLAAVQAANLASRICSSQDSGPDCSRDCSDPLNVGFLTGRPTASSCGLDLSTVGSSVDTDPLNRAFTGSRSSPLTQPSAQANIRSLSEPGVPPRSVNQGGVNQHCPSGADGSSDRQPACASERKKPHSVGSARRRHSSSFSDFSTERGRRGSLIFEFGQDFIFEEAKELSIIFRDKADNYRDDDSSPDDCDDDILTSRPQWETSNIALPPSSDGDDDDVFLPGQARAPTQENVCNLSLQSPSVKAMQPAPALPQPPAVPLAAKQVALAAVPLDRLRPRRQAAVGKGPMRAVVPVGEMTKRVAAERSGSVSPPSAPATPLPLGVPALALIAATPELCKLPATSVGPPMVASTPMQAPQFGLPKVASMPMQAPQFGLPMVASTPMQAPQFGLPMLASTPLLAAKPVRHFVKASPVASNSAFKSQTSSAGIESTPPRHPRAPPLRRSTSAGGLPSPGSRHPAPRQPPSSSGYGRPSSQRRRSLPPAEVVPVVPCQVESPRRGAKPLAFKSPNTKVESPGRGAKPLAFKSPNTKVESPGRGAKPLAFKSPNTKETNVEPKPGHRRIHSLSAIKSLFTSRRGNVASAEKENFQLA